MLRKDVRERTNDAELWWCICEVGHGSLTQLQGWTRQVVISLELLNFVPATPKIPQDLRCTFEVFTSMGGHAVNCRTDFTVSLSDRVIGFVGFSCEVRPFFRHFDWDAGNLAKSYGVATLAIAKPLGWKVI